MVTADIFKGGISGYIERCIADVGDRLADNDILSFVLSLRMQYKKNKSNVLTPRTILVTVVDDGRLGKERGKLSI